MELWLILSTVLGGIYVILLIAYLVVLVRNKNKEVQLQADLAKMYADPNLSKMDYDFCVYDEETEELIKTMQANESQTFVGSDNNATEDQLNIFGAVDTDGLEEITGKYKP